MSESYISLSPAGTCYSGPDAVAYFHARSLQGAISLYIKSSGQIIPTRGMTITKMLALATKITGKSYKRTQAQAAHDDLQIWTSTMRSALPITSEFLP